MTGGEEKEERPGTFSPVDRKEKTICCGKSLRIGKRGRGDKSLSLSFPRKKREIFSIEGEKGNRKTLRNWRRRCKPHQKGNLLERPSPKKGILPLQSGNQAGFLR